MFQKKKFNIDAALRYDPVVGMIKDGLFKNSTILEIGSGVNGISDFLDNEVIGVDSDFSKTETDKNSNISHIKAASTKLPFKDHAYEVVVCLDTFEHIPKKRRTKSLSELLRVLKKGGYLFIGFPSGNLTPFFERWVNNLYKSKHGKDHIWLKEHQELGIPSSKEVVSEIKNLGVKPKNIKILGNVNLFVWFMIHFIFTIHYDSQISKVLERLYILVYYPARKVTFGPFYRTILVVKNG